MSTEKNIQNESVVIELGKIGVVQEKREAFQESLFQSVYKEAGMLTAMIVKEQYGAEKEKHAIYEQPDNIITFVGRRGTGKSSSMLSFMDALKETKSVYDLEHIAEDTDVEEYKGSVNTEFIALEWIDASIMEKGEDVFEMLLAKIIGEILKKDNEFQNMDAHKDYLIRELHKSLGSLYKKVLKLKQRSKNLDSKEESPISALRELARSIDLRQEFEELIELYLKIKSENKNYGHNCFLVVAIDDVDMNIEYGFEILEQIQRYLKVNRLLVLLTIDYEQLLKCCEKHFEKLYGDDTRKRQIAESYIAKVLPFHMRVYLPSLKKKDYSRKREMRIRMDGQDYSIKEAIFKMIWERTKIRYDSQGRKRHFIESSNLRDLNNYFLFLQGMKEIDKDLPLNDDEAKKERKRRMEKNQRRNMDDILFRFAEEYLPEAEKSYFISLSEEDIRRRGEIVVANFLRDVGKVSYQNLRYTVFSDKYGSGQIHGFAEEMDVFGYSFGQFIRCLYFMGREVIYDKKLVHALLAMYTSAMTRIFYRYRQEGAAPDEKGSNYNILKTLLGSSAGGSWSLYMMPKVRSVVDEKEMYFSGAVAAVNLFNIDTAFIKDERLVNRLKQLKTIKDVKALKEQTCQLMKTMNKEMVFLLFLSNFGNLDSGYKLTINDQIPIKWRELKEKDRWQAEQYDKVWLTNSNGVQFNALNFINNIFAFKDCAKKFVMLLLDQAEDFWKTKRSLSQEKLADQIIDTLQEKNGFYREMQKWEQTYGGAVIPFYSVDIYYNLLKRLAREERQNPSNPIAKDELFAQLLKLLEKIRAHLSLSDQFYGIGNNSEESFVKIFDSCPVIQYLKDEGKKKRFVELYNDFVYEMVSNDKKGNRLQEIKDKMYFFMD